MSNHSAPAIDLHELHLVRLVATHRGITAAAKAAGLSQSALTRQIQLIEGRLGLRLFERTTRSVSLTEAAAVLLRETEVLPGLLDGALRRLREDFLDEPRQIAIGISRSVSLAHLPGLFHGQLRRHPEVQVSVSHGTGAALVEAVAACKLDLAVLCPPPRLPGSVAITHRIEDVFVLIVPAGMEVPSAAEDEAWRAWAAAQAWIVPPAGTRSRACIDAWWQKAKPAPPAAMELDSFDMSIQLVALGMGVAFVPRRALSSFPRKRQIRRIKLAWPLKRELAIIAPRRGTTPEHVREFIAEILFR